jgi:hypothetical protein
LIGRPKCNRAKIFRPQKHFLDSGKACVLKRKVTFLPKNDPFWGKNVRGIRFSRIYTAFLESEEFYKCQIRFPPTFLLQKGSFLDKNFLRLFASIHRHFLNQGSVFSLQKCQIWILRMFLLLEGSFPEKNFRKIFHVGGLPPIVQIKS